MKFNKISLLSLIFMAAPLFGMQQPPSLSGFGYNGASVMPFTAKPGSNNRFVLLAREALGSPDGGTYDAFGGRKDAFETHPVVTAAREFAEETVYILGGEHRIRNLIDVDGTHTLDVVANYNKSFAVYVTYFSETTLKQLTTNFYEARKAAKNPKNREKDELAWVSWKELASAIANAPRGSHGQLLGDTYVMGYIVDSNGQRVGQGQPIKLRRVFVSTMQPYFANAPYTAGVNAKIRFY